MSHKPRSFFELPEPVMDNIYRCLPLDDLINVGDVCDLWKEFTDKSSVWKHVPLYLNDYNIGKLSKTPYIHTVTGIAANKKLYLNAMLNNLQDLRQMDVTFCSYIPTVYVQKLVKKFTNLESITLYLSAPDIIETLNVLQNCPKLKEIQFCGFNKPYFCSWKPFFDKLGNIKSLDRLDLDHISQFASSSDVLYFLELKMKQLVSLKVTIDCLRNKDILDNISTVMSKIICDSDSLEKLEFAADINELPYDIFLNFAQIENLKSLKLRLQSRTQLNLLNQVTFPSSLEFLDLLFYSISNTSKILEHVIMSCPNLKYLKASGINDEDINELEQINVLKNLHTIILEYCQCLSPKGLQHIGKCSNLRYLALNNTSVDDSVYTSLKACKYLQEIKLENCGIRPKKLVPTVISLKHLTHLHLRTCYRTNGNNKVRLSAKYLKRIFRKCKKKNRALNIFSYYFISIRKNCRYKQQTYLLQQIRC